MHLILTNSTRSAKDTDVRLEWRRTSSGIEMDEVLVRVDGAGARIADASALERPLCAHVKKVWHYSLRHARFK